MAYLSKPDLDVSVTNELGNLKVKNDLISRIRFMLLVLNNFIKHHFYLGHMLLCYTSKLTSIYLTPTVTRLLQKQTFPPSQQ